MQAQGGLVLLIRFVVSGFRHRRGRARAGGGEECFNIRSAKEFLNLPGQLLEGVEGRFIAHFF